MKALANPHMRRLRRVIPSTLEAAERLCGTTRQLLGSHHLNQLAFPVELCLREALNNAVLHGNHGNPGKRVALDMRLGAKWITLRVTDQGPGFDWRKTLGTTADVTASHGRGMSIYGLYARRVAYNPRGNQLTLWLSRTKQEK